MRQIAVLNIDGIMKAIPSSAAIRIAPESERITQAISPVGGPQAISPVGGPQAISPQVFGQQSRFSPIIAPIGIRIKSDTQVPGSGITLNDGKFGRETDDNVIEQFQSPTTFGKQIVIVAEYWLAQKVREATGNNDGKYVALFEKDYYGEAVAQPWCAVFIWFCINEAAKVTNCTHNFPGGSKIWGSTAKTLAESKKVYNVDKNPVAGSVMFRKSTGPYNHMGIVIFQQGKFFYTVEGNVKLKDGKDGIGLWEYHQEEIRRFGMEIIHTEKNSCKPKSIATYKDYNSIQRMIAVSAGAGGGGFGGGTIKEPEAPEAPPAGIAEDPCDDFKPSEKNKDIVEKAKTQSQFDKLSETDKSIACTEVTIPLPAFESIPHFSEMRNGAFADDIAATHHSGRSIFEIRGSAMGLTKDYQDIGSYSQFGIFRDRNGNLIYIIPERNPKAVQLFNSQYIGPFDKSVGKYASYNTFLFQEIEAEKSENQKKYLYQTIKGERHGRMIATKSAGGRSQIAKDYSLHPDRSKSYKSPYTNDKWIVDNTHRTGGITKWDGEVQHEWLVDIPSLLSWIESKGKFKKPIVIYIRKSELRTQWKDLLKDIIKVTSLAVNFLPGGSVAQSVLSKFNMIAPVLRAASNGTSLTLDNYVTIASSLKGIASYMAPEFVTGLEDKAKNYIGAAEKSIENIYDRTNFAAAAKELGLVGAIGTKLVKDMQAMYNSVDSYVDIFGQYAKVFEGNFNDTAKKIVNFTNMNFIGKINSWIDTSGFSDEFTMANNFTTIPMIQDLFIVGASGGVFPSVAGLQAITSNLLSVGASTLEKYEKAGSEGDISVNLIKAAFGVPVCARAFDQLLLESLNNKIIDGGEKFLMPPSIEKEQAICYKFELEKANPEKEVIITCDDGYEYDPKLRRCVSNKVNVEFDFDKKGGKLPGGGIPDIIIEKPKVPFDPGGPQIPAGKLPGITIPDIRIEKPKLPGTPLIPSGPGTPLIPSGPGTPLIPSGPGTPLIPSGPGTPLIPSGPGTPLIPSIPDVETDPKAPCKDKLREKQAIIEKYIKELKIVSNKIKSCEQLNQRDRQKLYVYESKINQLYTELSKKSVANCDSMEVEITRLKVQIKEYKKLLSEQTNKIEVKFDETEKDREIARLKLELKEQEDKFSEYDKSIERIEKAEKHEKEQLPPCITGYNNEYYYAYDGNYLKAKKSGSYWLAQYQNYWVLIQNCKLQILPKNPTVPKKPPPPITPEQPRTPMPDRERKPIGDCPDCLKKETITRIYDYGNQQNDCHDCYENEECNEC